MKTPEYYLDEVAKEKGYSSIDKALVSYQTGNTTPLGIFSLVKEAMLRHSKEACEEQNPWIDVNEKHFVDITYYDDGRYEWEENNNCPNEPFLVALRVRNNKTGEYHWEKHLVVLTEGAYGIETPDGNDVGWNVTDVEHWMKVPDPKQSIINAKSPIE